MTKYLVSLLVDNGNEGMRVEHFTIEREDQNGYNSTSLHFALMQISIEGFANMPYLMARVKDMLICSLRNGVEDDITEDEFKAMHEDMLFGTN